MKKALAFLLVLLMVSSIFLVNIFAIETEETVQGNTNCSCGGSYGEWKLPDNGACVGGRYYRVCDGCDKKQTAKDVTSETISFSVPAIGANVGDLVMLSAYDVYFTSSTVKSAEEIKWSSEDIEIDEYNQIFPTKAGTYKLTATAGTSTKSVYLVVKNPTNTEYVLFYDDFNRDTLGDDYRALEVPAGTEYYMQDGKLVMDATGNDNNQMRILLPDWIGDFGNYKIDTSFNFDSAMKSTYWFAVMARIQNEDFPFWQAAVRQGAHASSGVEIARRDKESGASNGWNVPYKGKYGTKALVSGTYYNLTFELSGKNATHAINGTTLLTANNISYKVGDVGFHLRASVIYVDSIKIVVPIDDSIHEFGEWKVTKDATCTVDGVETRTCNYCSAKEERVIKAEHKGFGEWNVVTPATCTTKGTQQRVCADCGKVESSNINATGHSLVKQAVKAPTCTESGYREYNICSNCDYTTFAGMVDPYGHYFDRVIKSIAHRGYSNTAPENTLPAYILAKELGFLYAECDVAFTKDGVAVLLHDTTIDRTSDGSGNISELTYEELLQYDFGSWKNSKYKGTKIPTFEEFIALCKEIGLHPYIEIKNDGETYTQEQVQSLVGIVEKYGMEDNCTWISFNITYLEYVKNIDDTARLGYVSSKSITQSLINPVLALQTGKNEVFLDISYNMLNENNVMLAIQNGLEVETWTVDNTNDIKNRPKYISGYTSNKLIANDYVLKTAITAPTCNAQGYTTYTCYCGATKIDNYVPATEEHTYENGACTVCGASAYCADPTHSLEIISISYANGYSADGVKVVKCLDCGTVETSVIAEPLYTCAGYSMPESGSNSIAVGFAIDSVAISEFEASTGKTVEIGVVFAGYGNLGGKQPLDENGKAIALEQGKVIKADLSGFEYKTYDFVLTDIIDEIKDVKLVIAAYVYDGESVEYLQENSCGATVSGVTYYEAMEKIKK